MYEKKNVKKCIKINGNDNDIYRDYQFGSKGLWGEYEIQSYDDDRSAFELYLDDYASYTSQ